MTRNGFQVIEKVCKTPRFSDRELRVIEDVVNIFGEKPAINDRMV
jgi:hypothetical protein